MTRFWPYALFLLIVGVYSWFTLGQGFNATDEGYLLSLGQRVLDGQMPYRDFFFLRTPLSIYIQAGLLAVFGDSYTILASRIVWLLQMLLAALLLSVVYHRYVSRIETVALLLTTFAASTLLMSFPWYNYDAAVFAIVAAVLVFRRRFMAAGVAAALAMLCKQNYAALLPGYIFLALLVQWRLPAVRLLTRRDILHLAIGWATPTALFFAWLGSLGLMSAFVDNVVIWPTKASQTDLSFILFQNHAEAALAALPMILVVVIWLNMHRLKGAWQIVGHVAVAGTAVWIAISHHNFVYSFVYFGISTAVIFLAQVVRGKVTLKSEPVKALLPMLLFGLVLQYLAGFNYAGVILAYAGSGLLFAVAWVLMRNSGAGGGYRRYALEVLALVMLAAWFHRYDYVYRDAPRHDLAWEFKAARLNGLETSRRNNWLIDQMVAATEELTDSGDPVLVFPDFPVFYYLTDRVNPTPIAWYIQLEFGGPMTTRALESLRERPPKLILLQSYFEVDYERAGALIDYRSIPRYAPFYDFILRNYDKVRDIGDIALYRPRLR